MTEQTPREIIANVPGLPGGEIRENPNGFQIVVGYMAADDIIEALANAGYEIAPKIYGVKLIAANGLGESPRASEGERK